MIYYYSGTGNTRRAAQFIACETGDGLHFIPASGEVPVPAEGESMGFMFPIYSWGVPPVVTSFLDRLPRDTMQDRYIWAVCTCGDEAGIAMRLFSRHIRKLRGRGADALFSVIMPNDYVLLPGFDVDSPEVAAAKLKAAPQRLMSIARLVNSHAKGVNDVHEGSMPALRTRIVFPLFRRWGINPGRWRVDAACIGCGKCAASCPSGNISLTRGRPVWGKNCLSCCACFHSCPERTISYGSFTRGKGQYLCPGPLRHDVKSDEHSDKR